jgi:hypothetical protein
MLDATLRESAALDLLGPVEYVLSNDIPDKQLTGWVDPRWPASRRESSSPVNLSRRRRKKSCLRQGDGDTASDFALLVEDGGRPGCDSVVTAMTLRC